jgi:hypothetical protein
MRTKPSKPLPPALLLRCGCQVPFIEGEIALICPSHGVQTVARALRMPAPRFVGAVTGPHAVTKDLGAFVGRLAGSEGKAHGHD